MSRIDLLERLGRDLLVDRLEHRLALGRRQVLDDVGDVGRVQLRQPFVGDLQLDPPRRVGLEQVDELPGDDPRRDLLEQRPQRERRDDALAETADRAPGADVDGDDVESDVAVDRRRVELDVVDAHDLAAVDVDDLLIEEVALEQQQAVRRSVGLPCPASVDGADRRRRTISARRREAPARRRRSGRSGRRCEWDDPAARPRFRAPVPARRRWHRARWRRAVPTARRGTLQTRQCHARSLTVSRLMLSLNEPC